MSNKITMEMELRFNDNTSEGAKSVSKELDKVEKEATQAGQELDKLAKKKAKPTVDTDTSKADRKLSKLDSMLKKLGFRKTKTTIDTDDKATAKISKVWNKLRSYSGKKFKAFLELKDSDALRTLNKMSDGLMSLTRKTFRIPVKILDYATRPLRSLSNMLFSIKGLVAAITAGFAAQKLVINPINVADAYSSAKISFSTLLGESQGQKMMDNLDEFAKATPFNTTNVIENAQKMLAMGWEAENIIEDMEIIGNAAAATGKLDQGLESIVRALSQIKTKGKLSTEELNQLAEAGIAAKAMLAEGLGYGTGDKGIAKMTEDLEDGKIASDKAIAALLAGMQKYDGMMDSMANETVEGLGSQIKDAFDINVVRRWGQGLQDGAKRGFGTVVELLDASEGALSEFGDMLYDIGRNISNWLADKFQAAVDKILEITDSYEFRNASLGGKIKMLWDGVVADPLSEWWEGGGREKTAETAGKIGAWMGEMLTKGLLALFGATDVLNDGIGTDAGSSIAGSFLEGFLDNFDGQAITDAFVDAISNVWGALPWWAKLLIGGYGIGKAAGGIANLAGGVSSFIGGAKNVIGSFDIVDYYTAGAGGTGLLNILGKAGAGLGATTSTGAVIMGGTAITGGLAAGASLIKGGVDLYKSFTADDEVEKQAYATSGVGAVGGVATGATIGATIGSAIPGLGTALGALIGAGIGGISGWIWGDNEADKIREDAEKAKYASAELAERMADTEKSAEELAAEFEKGVWENMKNRMGDISLSLSEIQRIADEIVWGDDLGIFDTFNASAQQAAASLETLKNASATMDRWMWKAGLGITFTDDEKESIVASADEYVSSAQSYLENKHYEFTASADLLLDIESGTGKTILEAGNAFYAAAQKELQTAGEELGSALTEALADGIISAEEEAVIVAAQEKIASITSKIAQAEADAEIELIKVKWGDGNLDIDSFDTFMATMQTTLSERMSSTDAAFEAQITNLNLRFPTDADKQTEEYQEQLQAIIDGYNLQVESVKADILGVELGIVGDAYSDVLGEDAVAQLQAALEASLKDGIHPITWTQEQARYYLGIDDLEKDTAAELATMLGGVAEQLQIVEVNGQLMVNLGVQVPEDTATKAEQKITGAIPDFVDKTIDVLLSPLEKIQYTLSLSAGDFGVQPVYRAYPMLNVTPQLGTVSPIRLPTSTLYTQEFRGGIIGGGLEAFATGGIADGTDGGMVRGGARLITVAEEGSPEMIIPLSSQRRKRGLDLWEKAGQMMGVPGFFRGGRTDGGDEGIRFQGYGSGEGSGGQTVKVDVGGVKIELHINSDGSANIVEAVKAQLGQITDAVVGAIADELGAMFENTPVRGGS